MKLKLLSVLLISLISLSASAFDFEVNGIAYNINSDGETVTVTMGGSKTSGALTIPSSVTPDTKTYTVTSIGESAFAECSDLTLVSIPSSITSMEDMAFHDCDGLEKVIIESLEAWCNIDFVDFTSSPLFYASHLYIHNEEVTHLVIPDKITELKPFAFAGCIGITSVAIPNSVTHIRKGALGRTGLTSVTIPNSITCIELGTFTECSSLISVSIPSSVTSIEGEAFAGCSSLASVTIPGSVTSIGKYAFEHCSSLASIAIGKGVSSIEKWAFAGCSSLQSVTIPNTITVIENSTFYGCRNLTSVKIPSSITCIEKNAFEGCGLTSVFIPNSVTSIGEHAFSACSNLVSVSIGSGVTNIGEDAFFACSYLRNVTNLSTTPQTIASNVFWGYSTLHVLPGCAEAYRNADYWKQFTIVEDAVDPVRTITFDNDNYNTYCSDIPLDFSDIEGLKAYVASGFSPATCTLTITRMDVIPAGVGILLKGTPNESYDVHITDKTRVVANLLKGTNQGAIIHPTDGDMTNFVLKKNDDEDQLGFYPFNTPFYPILPHRAWLQIPTSVLGGSQVSITGFRLVEDGEETSGIAEISGEAFNEDQEGVIYDLQGRRLLSAPASGLYIINGKKVFK